MKKLRFKSLDSFIIDGAEIMVEYLKDKKIWYLIDVNTYHYEKIIDSFDLKNQVAEYLTLNKAKMVEKDQ